MNLLRKLTQRVDNQKLVDALLVLAIVIMAVTYKLNKA
jgi:hypothetical protein